jgi:hypothetical protein
MSTITTSERHGVEVGDVIGLSVPDGRWWRRALHWILRRPPPLRMRYLLVGKVTGSTLTCK